MCKTSETHSGCISKDIFALSNIKLTYENANKEIKIQSIIDDKKYDILWQAIDFGLDDSEEREESKNQQTHSQDTAQENQNYYDQINSRKCKFLNRLEVKSSNEFELKIYSSQNNDCQVDMFWYFTPEILEAEESSNLEISEYTDPANITTIQPIKQNIKFKMIDHPPVLTLNFQWNTTQFDTFGEITNNLSTKTSYYHQEIEELTYNNRLKINRLNYDQLDLVDKFIDLQISNSFNLEIVNRVNKFSIDLDMSDLLGRVVASTVTPTTQATTTEANEDYEDAEEDEDSGWGFGSLFSGSKTEEKPEETDQDDADSDSDYGEYSYGNYNYDRKRRKKRSTPTDNQKILNDLLGPIPLTFHFNANYILRPFHEKIHPDSFFLLPIFDILDYKSPKFYCDSDCYHHFKYENYQNGLNDYQISSLIQRPEFTENFDWFGDIIFELNDGDLEAGLANTKGHFTLEMAVNKIKNFNIQNAIRFLKIGYLTLDPAEVTKTVRISQEYSYSYEGRQKNLKLPDPDLAVSEQNCVQNWCSHVNSYVPSLIWQHKTINWEHEILKVDFLSHFDPMTQKISQVEMITKCQLNQPKDRVDRVLTLDWGQYDYYDNKVVWKNSQQKIAPFDYAVEFSHVFAGEATANQDFNADNAMFNKIDYVLDLKNVEYLENWSSLTDAEEQKLSQIQKFYTNYLDTLKTADFSLQKNYEKLFVLEKKQQTNYGNAYGFRILESYQILGNIEDQGENLKIDLNLKTKTDQFENTSGYTSNKLDENLTKFKLNPQKSFSSEYSVLKLKTLTSSNINNLIFSNKSRYRKIGKILNFKHVVDNGQALIQTGQNDQFKLDVTFGDYKFNLQGQVEFDHVAFSHELEINCDARSHNLLIESHCQTTQLDKFYQKSEGKIGYHVSQTYPNVIDLEFYGSELQTQPNLYQIKFKQDSVNSLTYEIYEKINNLPDIYLGKIVNENGNSYNLDLQKFNFNLEFVKSRFLNVMVNEQKLIFYQHDEKTHNFEFEQNLFLPLVRKFVLDLQGEWFMFGHFWRFFGL